MRQGWIVDGYLARSVEVRLWTSPNADRPAVWASPEGGPHLTFVEGEDIFFDREAAIKHALAKVKAKMRELEAGAHLLVAQLGGTE